MPETILSQHLLVLPLLLPMIITLSKVSIRDDELEEKQPTHPCSFRNHETTSANTLMVHVKQFDLPLNQPGSHFQQQVWEQLLKITYGNTLPICQQSQQMKNPLAIRAIAAANGRNNLWILVPCHRVIGSNGSLTGYAGGLWRKKWLLEHEAHVMGVGQTKLPF
jgi:methylated-DNA-[protein]-cysteine S-methyltransferase